jgi:hypothetical protein
VGESGLDLRRAAHSQFAADGQACVQLWCAGLVIRGREPTGDDQLCDGAAHVAQEPCPQSALPRIGPNRANQVTKGLPVGRIPWDTQEPGHFETDLAHHGGKSAG